VTNIAGEKPPSPSDLAALPPAEMEKTMDRLDHEPGHRLAARLAAWKNFAMIPAATVLLPFLRMRGFTGLYLYCLARKRDGVSKAIS
jgi:hypothetical protein